MKIIIKKILILDYLNNYILNKINNIYKINIINNNNNIIKPRLYYNFKEKYFSLNFYFMYFFIFLLNLPLLYIGILL